MPASPARFPPRTPIRMRLSPSSSRRVVTVLALGAFCAPPPAAEAQTRPAVPLVELAASTRALALGGAYPMSSGEPGAVFHHPELLRGSSGIGLDIQRWGPNGSYAAAAAAASWFGGDFGVGLGIQSLQFEQTGRLAIDRDEYPQDPLFRSGTTQVSERAAVLGIARTLAPLLDVDLGVGLRFVERRIGGDQDADTELAVGAGRELGPFTVGVAFRDLLDDPSELSLGIGSYGWEVGFLDVGVSARLEGFDGSTRIGGGVELGYWPIRGRTFVARFGAQDVPDGSDGLPLTVGFAYWGDELRMEWGFHPFEDAAQGGTHRFSIGWR